MPRPAPHPPRVLPLCPVMPASQATGPRSSRHGGACPAVSAHPAVSPVGTPPHGSGGDLSGIHTKKAVNVVHGFQGSDTRQQLLPLLPFGPDGVGSAAAARPFVTLAGKRRCVKIMPHSPPQPDRAVSGTAYYGRACCGSARLGSSRRHQGSQGSARCGCGSCARQ